MLIGLTALVFASVAAGGMALVRRHRRRRAAEALRREEENFDLVFPEGPDERRTRRTAVGRRIARR
jgi:hypothetical protein